MNDSKYNRNLKQSQTIFLATCPSMSIITFASVAASTITVLKLKKNSLLSVFLKNSAVLHCEVCLTLEYSVLSYRYYPIYYKGWMAYWTGTEGKYNVSENNRTNHFFILCEEVTTVNRVI